MLMNSRDDQESKAESAKLPLIVYRGDSRPPQQIFADGFKTRDASAPHYDEYGLPNIQSRVCMSKDISAAALFPLEHKEAIQDTWIYIISVTPSEDYEDFAETLDKKCRQDVHKWDAYCSLMFSQEVNVNEVKASQIMGAIKCTRVPLAETYHDGGVYKLTEFIKNDKFEDHNQKLEQVINENQALLNSWQSFPTYPTKLDLIKPDLLTFIYKEMQTAGKLGNFYLAFNILQNLAKQFAERDQQEILRLLEKDTQKKESFLSKTKFAKHRSILVSSFKRKVLGKPACIPSAKFNSSLNINSR